MGFGVVDETTYQAQASGRDAPDFWLHDMALTQTDGAKAGLGILKPRLEACFMMAMRGLAESDGFNALVLAAGLPWRDIAMLRPFARYLRQIRVPHSQDYLWATLVKHAAIAAKLAELFHLRFDPRLEPAAPSAGDQAPPAAPAPRAGPRPGGAGRRRPPPTVRRSRMRAPSARPRWRPRSTPRCKKSTAWTRI